MVLPKKTSAGSLSYGATMEDIDDFEAAANESKIESLCNLFRELIYTLRDLEVDFGSNDANLSTLSKKIKDATSYLKQHKFSPSVWALDKAFESVGLLIMSENSEFEAPVREFLEQSEIKDFQRVYDEIDMMPGE